MIMSVSHMSTVVPLVGVGEFGVFKHWSMVILEKAAAVPRTAWRAAGSSMRLSSCYASFSLYVIVYLIGYAPCIGFFYGFPGCLCIPPIG